MDIMENNTPVEKIEQQCAALVTVLKSKNASEETIRLRLSRYREFLLDHMKKSAANSARHLQCEDKKSSAQVIGAHRSQSPHPPKKEQPKTGSDENNFSEKTHKSPKSPIKEIQSSTSLRTDGDSGISSERKSPLGIQSRGRSNDSTARDSPVRRKTVDQTLNSAVKIDENRNTRTRETSNLRKRRSSSSSSSSLYRSRSRSVTGSRSRSRAGSSASRSRSKSKSKRRSHKKHRKGKKRRKRHHRHSRRRSDRRSRSSRSPSYSRYRSRSRSHSRRGRRRRHRRSRSRSPVVYSSLSRSPSIRRRPGSPSHLDRRRITRYAVRSPPRGGNLGYGGRVDRPAFTSSFGMRMSGLPWHSQLRR